MSNINAASLHHRWRDMYDKYKIQKGLSRFSGNERHRIFNNLLLNYLFECQENQYLPSKDVMDIKAGALHGESENILALGDVEKDRLDIHKMDIALQQMSFAPIQTDHDERGDLEQPFLCVFGLVSIKGLTKNERLYICDCFKADYNQDYDAINIVLMKVPLCGAISEEKQDRINAYCLRVARMVLDEYLKREINQSTGFKYPIWQKIKDKYLDSTI